MFQVIRLKIYWRYHAPKAIWYRSMSPLFRVRILQPDHIGFLVSFIAYAFKPAARTTFCKAVLGHWTRECLKLVRLQQVARMNVRL